MLTRYHSDSRQSGHSIRTTISGLYACFANEEQLRLTYSQCFQFTAPEGFSVCYPASALTNPEFADKAHKPTRFHHCL
jgi:hypothetical protein